MFRNIPFQAVLLVCLTLPVCDATAKKAVTPDEEIKQHLIDESISAYSGSCACPYNSARNGSRCGKRSAWSKPGGADPLCYKDDVSEEQVEAWRRAHGE
jgi:hypothetical protein